MALNLVDLETVLAEIQPVLTGGWIQKIHQPLDLVLTLDIRSPGEFPLRRFQGLQGLEP